MKLKMLFLLLQFSIYHLSVALCALQFSCYYFDEESLSSGEQPSGVYAGHSTEINSSVLIYNQAQAAELTNIPTIVNEEAISKQENGFGVCSRKLFESGKCDNLGEFIIKTNNGAELPASFMTTPTMQKENYTFFLYYVTSPGLYCAVIYQDIDQANVEDAGIIQNNGLDISAAESNGQLLGLSLLHLSNTIMGVVLKWKYESARHLGTDYLATPLPYIFINSLLNTYSVGYYFNTLGSRLIFHYMLSDSCAEKLMRFGNLVLLWFLLKFIFDFSLNYDPDKFEPYVKLKNITYGKHSFKRFIFLLSLYTLSVAVFDICELEYIPTLAVIKIIGSPVIIIPSVIGLLNVNFELSTKNIDDPHYRKSYKRSKIAIFTVFINAVMLCMLYEMLKPLNTREDFVTPSTKLGRIKNVIGSYLMSKVVSQWIFIIIYLHPSFFSPPLLCLSLMVIWRPRVDKFPSPVYTYNGKKAII